VFFCLDAEGGGEKGNTDNADTGVQGVINPRLNSLPDNPKTPAS